MYLKRSEHIKKQLKIDNVSLSIFERETPVEHKNSPISAYLAITHIPIFYISPWFTGEQRELQEKAMSV